MRIEKVINRLKEFLLWTYVAALLGGIVYAACTGQDTELPLRLSMRIPIHDNTKLQ